MNWNIRKNESHDERQRFRLIKTQQSSSDDDDDDDDDEITIRNTKLNEMITNPIRRVNLISGPQSAFARLFPDKYRQQEELIRKQRSKSTDNQHSNRIQTQYTSSDDEDEGLRKSRRVRFYTDEKNTLKTCTKSEPYLHQIHLSSDYSTNNQAHHPINYNPDSEITYHDHPDDVVYTQKVGVRYLRPPTPPPSGPILIREIQSTPPNDPPPLVVPRTPPVIPRTPSPLIVREEPPIPPEYQPAEVITKTLPAPPTSPRRVIIKHIPPLPAKPRPVIIEKWLPYKTLPERPVLYQRTEHTKQILPLQRNTILQYKPPRVQIKQEYQNFGCFRVDPDIYRTQYGTSLRRTESVRRLLENIGCNNDLITSTGYKTCYPSSCTQNNNNNTSSHYDYPRRTTNCFSNEQLDALLGPSLSTTTDDHHYDIPRIHDEDRDFYVNSLSNT